MGWKLNKQDRSTIITLFLMLEAIVFFVVVIVPTSIWRKWILFLFHFVGPSCRCLFGLILSYCSITDNFCLFGQGIDDRISVRFYLIALLLIKLFCLDWGSMIEFLKRHVFVFSVNHSIKYYSWCNNSIPIRFFFFKELRSIHCTEEVGLLLKKEIKEFIFFRA